jgi:hypothetical protein
VLQQLDQIAPCAVVIDVGASAARHHPCRHAVYVCRARLQWIYARRMCLLRFTAAVCADQWLPSGVSGRRMKRCDTLRDVLSGAGGQGGKGKRGKGATERSTAAQSCALRLRRSSARRSACARSGPTGSGRRWSRRPSPSSCAAPSRRHV